MNIKKLLHQFEDIMSASYMEEGRFETAKRMLNGRRKVLLVLTGMEADTDAVRYALNLSRRIGAGIKILYLAQDYSEVPRIENSLQELKAIGISYQINHSKGSIKEEIIQFIDAEKETDISFVVIDSMDLGIHSLKNQKTDFQDWERPQCPLVLVSKTSHFFPQRRMDMSQKFSNRKKKPIVQMVAFGICSTIIYAALLSYQGLITAYFTRGALYAVLPIAGAFALSYFHGHFTGYFWTVLGIEARKSAVVMPRTEVERPERRERPQPQPRLRA
jgi:hypothetical protein